MTEKRRKRIIVMLLATLLAVAPVAFALAHSWITSISASATIGIADYTTVTGTVKADDSVFNDLSLVGGEVVFTSVSGSHAGINVTAKIKTEIDDDVYQYSVYLPKNNTFTARLSAVPLYLDEQYLTNSDGSAIATNGTDNQTFSPLTYHHYRLNNGDLTDKWSADMLGGVSQSAASDSSWSYDMTSKTLTAVRGDCFAGGEEGVSHYIMSGTAGRRYVLTARVKAQAYSESDMAGIVVADLDKAAAGDNAYRLALLAEYSGSGVTLSGKSGAESLSAYEGNFELYNGASYKNGKIVLPDSGILSCTTSSHRTFALLGGEAAAPTYLYCESGAYYYESGGAFSGNLLLAAFDGSTYTLYTSYVSSTENTLYTGGGTLDEASGMVTDGDTVYSVACVINGGSGVIESDVIQTVVRYDNKIFYYIDSTPDNGVDDKVMYAKITLPNSSTELSAGATANVGFTSAAYITEFSDIFYSTQETVINEYLGFYTVDIDTQFGTIQPGSTVGLDVSPVTGGYKFCRGSSIEFTYVPRTAQGVVCQTNSDDEYAVVITNTTTKTSTTLYYPKNDDGTVTVKLGRSVAGTVDYLSGDFSISLVSKSVANLTYVTGSFKTVLDLYDTANLMVQLVAADGTVYTVKGGSNTQNGKKVGVWADTSSATYGIFVPYSATYTLFAFYRGGGSALTSVNYTITSQSGSNISTATGNKNIVIPSACAGATVTVSSVPTVGFALGDNAEWYYTEDADGISLSNSDEMTGVTWETRSSYIPVAAYSAYKSGNPYKNYVVEAEIEMNCITDGAEKVGITVGVDFSTITTSGINTSQSGSAYDGSNIAAGDTMNSSYTIVFSPWQAYNSTGTIRVVKGFSLEAYDIDGDVELGSYSMRAYSGAQKTIYEKERVGYGSIAQVDSAGYYATEENPIITDSDGIATKPISFTSFKVKVIRSGYLVTVFINDTLLTVIDFTAEGTSFSNTSGFGFHSEASKLAKFTDITYSRITIASSETKATVSGSVVGANVSNYYSHEVDFVSVTDGRRYSSYGTSPAVTLKNGAYSVSLPDGKYIASSTLFVTNPTIEAGTTIDGNVRNSCIMTEFTVSGGVVTVINGESAAKGNKVDFNYGKEFRTGVQQWTYNGGNRSLYSRGTSNNGVDASRSVYLLPTEQYTPSANYTFSADLTLARLSHYTNKVGVVIGYDSSTLSATKMYNFRHYAVMFAPAAADVDGNLRIVGTGGGMGYFLDSYFNQGNGVQLNGRVSVFDSVGYTTSGRPTFGYETYFKRAELSFDKGFLGSEGGSLNAAFKKVRISVTRIGYNVYVFVDGTLLAAYDFKGVEGFDNENVIGVGIHNENTPDFRLENIEYTVLDSEAAAEFAAGLATNGTTTTNTVTFNVNSGFGGTIDYVSGFNADGTINLGSEIVFRVTMNEGGWFDYSQIDGFIPTYVSVYDETSGVLEVKGIAGGHIYITANADVNAYTVSGSVYESEGFNSGLNINLTEVVFTDAEFNNMSFTASLDEDGEYSLWLPARRYKVTYTHPNFRVKSVSSGDTSGEEYIDVSANTTMNFELFKYKFVLYDPSNMGGVSENPDGTDNDTANGTYTITAVDGYSSGYRNILVDGFTTTKYVAQATFSAPQAGYEGTQVNFGIWVDENWRINIERQGTSNYGVRLLTLGLGGSGWKNFYIHSFQDVGNDKFTPVRQAIKNVIDGTAPITMTVYRDGNDFVLYLNGYYTFEWTAGTTISATDSSVGIADTGTIFGEPSEARSLDETLGFGTRAGAGVTITDIWYSCDANVVDGYAPVTLNATASVLSSILPDTFDASAATANVSGTADGKWTISSYPITATASESTANFATKVMRGSYSITASHPSFVTTTSSAAVTAGEETASATFTQYALDDIIYFGTGTNAYYTRGDIGDSDLTNDNAIKLYSDPSWADGTSSITRAVLSGTASTVAVISGKISSTAKQNATKTGFTIASLSSSCDDSYDVLLSPTQVTNGGLLLVKGQVQESAKVYDSVVTYNGATVNSTNGRIALPEGTITTAEDGYGLKECTLTVIRSSSIIYCLIDGTLYAKFYIFALAGKSASLGVKNMTAVQGTFEEFYYKLGSEATAQYNELEASLSST